MKKVSTKAGAQSRNISQQKLSERIRECNERIEDLEQKSYPQVALLEKLKSTFHEHTTPVSW